MRRSAWLGDIAIAVGVTCVPGFVFAALSDEPMVATDNTGELVRVVVSFVAVIGLLIYRRRIPLIVAIAVLGVASLAPEESWALFAGPFFMAFYLVPAYRPVREAVAFLALPVLVDVPSILDGHVVGVIIGTLTALVPWTIGLRVGRSRRQTQGLRDLARDLQAQQEEQARRAVADERARIARELHDVVANHVSLMVIQSEVAQAAGEADARKAAEQIGALGRDALVELRRLLGVLREGDVPVEGLAQLPELITRMEGAGLDVDLTLEPGELAPSLDVTAFRIVQEALTNVVKHAGSVPVTVRVQRRGGDLVVEVRNERSSSEATARLAELGAGRGLAGMRERVQVFGGRLEAGPDGTGFAVRATLPLGSSPAVAENRDPEKHKGAPGGDDGEAHPPRERVRDR